jgi:hypothetical protein
MHTFYRHGTTLYYTFVHVMNALKLLLTGNDTKYTEMSFILQRTIKVAILVRDQCSKSYVCGLILSALNLNCLI